MLALFSSLATAYMVSSSMTVRSSLPIASRALHVLVMGQSYECPECPPLPDGIADVDALSAEQIRGFNNSGRDDAIFNLEVAIFDSPPFEKVNESERRRNLALAMFLQDDPALHPALIPHAKEVLRQTKDADAEMQYVLGICMRSCKEGASSQAFALMCFKKALELQPDYPDTKESLEQAQAA